MNDSYEKLVKDKFDATMEINKLKRQKAEIVDGIVSCQQKVTEINRKIQRGLNYNDFKKLTDEKERAIKALRQFEKKSRLIKGEIDQWIAVESTIHAQLEAVSIGGKPYPSADVEGGAVPSDTPALRVAVATLRAKYAAFAEDQTRVNSMRIVAAQIANELTDLLRL